MASTAVNGLSVHAVKFSIESDEHDQPSTISVTNATAFIFCRISPF